MAEEHPIDTQSSLVTGAMAIISLRTTIIYLIIAVILIILVGLSFYSVLQQFVALFSGIPFTDGILSIPPYYPSVHHSF